MGIMDKFKEIFFEPVEQEDEIPVKKEVSVAKKIELPPETKKVREEPVRVEKEEEIEEIITEEQEEEVVETSPKKPKRQFPMDFDERDFKVEGSREERYQEPQREVIIEKTNLYERPYDKTKDRRYEKAYEKAYEKKYDTISPVKKEEASKERGLYEGNDRKKEFKPSPIISPIYGVLDKNYKKEEIVSKKEIRLSTPSQKKLDLDSVREKAYGDLASEISASILDEELEVEPREQEIEVEEENLLYDLSEESAPKVAKVTVGDAEEYFNELGLEYNVDYQDTSKEKELKKKTVKKEKSELSPQEEKNLRRVKEEKEIEPETKTPSEETVESNLFDLIDSMYEEKE